MAKCNIMNTIETYRGVVYPNQLDHMNHMNVQWYISKFDEGTWQLFSFIGITSKYMRDNNKGMAALEQITKYKAEVMAGDLLVVKSRVLEVKDKTIRFMHTMYNAETDDEVATTELVAVHLDTKKRKGCSLPDDIRARCERLIEKGFATRGNSNERR